MYVFRLFQAFTGAEYPFIEKINLEINLYLKLVSFLTCWSFFSWKRGDNTNFPPSSSSKRPFYFLKSSRKILSRPISIFLFFTYPSSSCICLTLFASISNFQEKKESLTLQFMAFLVILLIKFLAILISYWFLLHLIILELKIFLLFFSKVSITDWIRFVISDFLSTSWLLP